MAFTTRVLPGLPPYGPPAIPFSATGLGTHSEGFVVEVTPENEPSWTGNFQPGLGGLTGVFAHSDALYVISGGEGYLLDPGTAELRNTFGGALIWAVESADWLLLHDGIKFYGFGPNSAAWVSRRVSWDGCRNVEVSNVAITGEAWEPSGLWHPFSVEIATGNADGGSYADTVSRRAVEPAAAGRRRAPAFLRWFGFGVYVALHTVLPSALRG